MPPGTRDAFPQPQPWLGQHAPGPPALSGAGAPFCCQSPPKRPPITHTLSKATLRGSFCVAPTTLGRQQPPGQVTAVRYTKSCSWLPSLSLPLLACCPGPVFAAAANPKRRVFTQVTNPSRGCVRWAPENIQKPPHRRLMRLPHMMPRPKKHSQNLPPTIPRSTREVLRGGAEPIRVPEASQARQRRPR